jgi:hypothetical protein
MKISTKNAQGSVVYSREVDSDKDHTAKILGVLMEVPQGDAYNTTVETGSFSHTFKHNESLSLKNLVLTVEGVVVRKRAPAA